MTGTPSSRPEFTPLLEIGRHEMSVGELRKLCVDSFPLSATRPLVMGGLEKVISRLRNDNVDGEVWVNGSFLTEKVNPNDVDIVLRISADLYENGTITQRRAIDWLNSDLKSAYYCYSFFFLEWPEGNSKYWLGEYMHSYWMKQFGFSRGEEIKGIAVINLVQGG
jgi:hypothetical protein